MRFLLVALMGLALAACDLGASTPSAEPLPSVGMESMGTDASSSASATADASSVTGMTCEEAFAALDVTSLSAMTDLDSAADMLDDTIGSCVNVAEWEAELTALLPELNLDEAEAFLAARCEENDLIGDSPICEELDV